ncbi:unnamed protein product [Citrullus colocynthis]|uniref:Uncharacterized protein n=1 Tax=Citrullus colocynthis TaxID=252529 RepID=A0ABP0ZD03_9ROSI
MGFTAKYFPNPTIRLSSCDHSAQQSVSGNFVPIPFPTQKVVAKKVLFVHTAMMVMMMPVIPNSSINPPQQNSSPFLFLLPSLFPSSLSVLSSP